MTYMVRFPIEPIIRWAESSSVNLEKYQLVESTRPRLVSNNVIHRLYQTLRCYEVDQPLGLLCGTCGLFSDFGLGGQIVQHSPSLIYAYERYFQQFWSTYLQHAFLNTSHREGDCFVVRPHPDVTLQSSEAFRVSYLFVLGLQLYRQLIGQSFLAAEEVWFAHAEDKFSPVYQTFFGCSIRYNAPENRLILARGTFALPVVGAVPSTLPFLEQLICLNEQQVGNLSRREDDFITQVRQALRDEIIQGDPSETRLAQESIAKRLSISKRTLQRRLLELDVCFRVLREEIQYTSALELLLDSELSIEAIAYQLGYAHVGGFHRAFKRWSRSSPGEVRQQHEKIK